MNVLRTHRFMFMAMAGGSLALSAASFLAGRFAGPQITSMLGQCEPARWLESTSTGFAVFICAGAMLCVAIGSVICFTGLSNASMNASVFGTIRRSEIRSFPCDEGMEHYIYSTVSYSIEGTACESEGRHRFSSNSEDAIKERLTRIRPGDLVCVFYKPGDPEVIDLDEAPKDRWGSILGGAALEVAGLAMLFLAGNSLAS